MKIGIVFPGYASQKIGMAKELYDESRAVQELFEVAGNCLPINFVKLCFASSESELAKIENAWPALFLTGQAFLTLLHEHDILPSLYAGYNIGLYTAACAAKSITLPDGLYLLSKYAEIYRTFLERHAYECRKISGVSVDDVSTLCERYAENGEQTYVSTFDDEKLCRVVGTKDLLDKLSHELERFSAVSVTPDLLGHELHAPLAQECVDPFVLYMHKVDVKDASAPLILSSNATESLEGAAIHDELVNRITKPVRWYRSARLLRTMDCIIQIGPGTALVPFLEKEFTSIPIFSLNSFADLEHIKKSIKPQQQELVNTEELSDGSTSDQTDSD